MNKLILYFFILLLIGIQNDLCGQATDVKTDERNSIFGLSFSAYFPGLDNVNRALQQANISTLNTGGLQGGIVFGSRLSQRFSGVAELTYLDIVSTNTLDRTAHMYGIGANFKCIVHVIDGRIKVKGYAGLNTSRYILTVEDKIAGGTIANLDEHRSSNSFVIPYMTTLDLGVEWTLGLTGYTNLNLSEIGLRAGYILGFDDNFRTKSRQILSNTFNPRGIHVGLIVYL